MEEIKTEYCRLSNLTHIDNWDFYMSFVLFRTAAILQGVYKRNISGTDMLCLVNDEHLTVSVCMFHSIGPILDVPFYLFYMFHFIGLGKCDL